MAVEYETLVQGGHSKFAEEIFRKIKDKSLVDIVNGSDSFPYHFRQTPYGDRLKDKIVGGTVAFNQLIENPTEVFTCSATASLTKVIKSFEAVKDHVYFSFVYQSNDMQSNIRNTLFFAWANNTSKYERTNENYHLTKGYHYLMGKCPETGATIAYLWCHTPDVDVSYTNFNLIDLTHMFGTETADRLYTLEQTTAGAGVSLFRELFPKDYYEYDAGSLQSVSGLQSHDEVGKNLFDKSKAVVSLPNYHTEVVGEDIIATCNGSFQGSAHVPIPVIYGETYCISGNIPSGCGFEIRYDDENGNSTYQTWVVTSLPAIIVVPNSNTKRIRVLCSNRTSGAGIYTFKNIQVELGSVATEYVPYKKHSYALDSSLTLRGVPKLVDNKIKFDGDVYESDGKVTRRYGVVDLGTLDWDIMSSPDTHIFRAQLNDAKSSSAIQSQQNDPVNAIISCCYICKGYTPLSGNDDKCFAIGYSPSGVTDTRFVIVDHAYSDIDTFKTAMSGVMLVYELATPTIEEAQPYANPQRCVEGGTEEYVTTGIVPVGHESEYVSNKAERFDALPDAAQEDGDYVIRQENGVMELVDAEESSKLVESESGNPITVVTDSAQFAKNTHLTFEPIQDLHGYDHPWPAGGGKNLLPMTVDNIKSINTNGTWNGNTYTLNGLTFIIRTDSGDNVTGILVNGTSTSATVLYLAVDESNPISPTNGTILNGVLPFINGAYKDDSGWHDITLSESVQLNSGIKQLWIRTGSGSTFTNILIQPMLRLTTESDPTFEPYSNICPITGVDEVEVRATGKNLASLNCSWYTSAYGTAETNQYYISSIIRVAQNEQYTISGNGGSGDYSVVGFYYEFPDENSVSYNNGRSVFNANYTFTSPIDGYAVIRSNVPYKDTVQIERGSTATAYEPYHGTELTSSLPETVYGGTLDLTTGELVVDMSIVDLGTLTWYRNTTHNIFFASLPTNSLNVTNASGVCSQYSPTTKPLSGTTWSILDNLTFVLSANLVANGRCAIALKDISYTDETTFKQAMSGVQLAYPLATPVTYTLTPKQLSLLKGTNHISANAKTVKVTFRAGQLATLEDVAGAVKIADEHLETALTPILGDFADIETSPAASNHSVGEYLLYNNRLFKVLAAISAGQQLTIGTNVGQTNVAAELASLNSFKGKIQLIKNYTASNIEGFLLQMMRDAVQLFGTGAGRVMFGGIWTGVTYVMADIYVTGEQTSHAVVTYITTGRPIYVISYNASTDAVTIVRTI